RNRARVSAVFEQVRRERMAEDVWRYAVQPRAVAVCRERLVEGLPRDRSPAVADEQALRLAPREQSAPRRLVPLQPFDGRASDGHATLLAPLARAEEHSRIEVNARLRKVDKL